MPAAMEQEIVQAIRAAQDRPRPLVDVAAGKSWIARFQEGLRGLPIEDRTDYRYGNTGAYTLQAALPFAGGGNWTYYVRIRISGLGPYVMHAFFRESVTDAQWGGACHMVRGGLTPEQDLVAEQLRACYGRFGLTEVDEPTRALPVENVRLPGHTGALNVFRCLFLP